MQFLHKQHAGQGEGSKVQEHSAHLLPTDSQQPTQPARAQLIHPTDPL